MDDSSNICLSCGLCCDGTLIGFVQLDQKEVPALREIMEIEEENNENIFLQPCDKYCNGCTIYSERPVNCIKFKCGLLKNLEQKKLTFDSAINTIELAKEKRGAIEEQITSLNLNLRSQSFYFKIVELNKILQTPKFDSYLTAENHNIINNIRELEELIIEKFNLSFS
jgi:hypothetical protein